MNKVKTGEPAMQLFSRKYLAELRKRVGPVEMIALPVELINLSIVFARVAHKTWGREAADYMAALMCGTLPCSNCIKKQKQKLRKAAE